MTKMPTIPSNRDRVIATANNELYDTKTKIRLPASQLRVVTQLKIPGINYLIANDAFPHVAELNEQNGWDPKWVCRFVARRKTVIRQGKQLRIGSFVPVYFGFKEFGKGGTRTIKYKYFCISTDDILNSSARSSENYSIDELVEIAYEILTLVKERTGNKSSTMSNGAIATRLLKACKEWSSDRRPAPKFTNDFAQSRLPGNHYSLSVATGIAHRVATYLDQNSAHHAVAQTTAVPDPGSLRARGHYRDLEGKWLRNGSPEFDEFKRSHIGLVCACVTVANIPRQFKHLIPEWLKEPGRVTRFFYTNEWYYFEKWKNYVELNYVTASWTSTTADRLVPEYATWALEKLDGIEGVARKPIKSILLAAYGMLATDCSKVSSNYYHPGARGGRTVTLARAGETREINFKPKGFNQPSVRNVIARGIIEAETRKRSLEYANTLQEVYGIRTLCVYADGIIVDSGRIPFLAPGWKIQTYLHNVLFLHPTAFTSHEMSKIPGQPKDLRATPKGIQSIHRERQCLNLK